MNIVDIKLINNDNQDDTKIISIKYDFYDIFHQVMLLDTHDWIEINSKNLTDIYTLIDRETAIKILSLSDSKLIQENINNVRNFSSIMEQYKKMTTDNLKVHISMLEMEERLKVLKIINSKVSFKIINQNIYYPVSALECPEYVLPYIMQDNHIRWYLKYNEVKVIEFLDTHNIKNNEIIGCFINNDLKTNLIIDNIINALDFKTIERTWVLVYPILEQILTTASAIKLLVSAHKFLKKKFGEKVSSINFFEFITSKNSWKKLELASCLEISPDRAKEILKLCGYKWDSHCKAYLSTNETIQFSNKLNEIHLKIYMEKKDNDRSN